MTAFTEIRYWSPMRGANVLRIGMQGMDGVERHVIVDMDVGGKERRRRRNTAIDRLDRVLNERPAGEVEIDLSEDVEV
jgi:hypothetical protein